jgi:ribosome biogenesis GTPase
MVVRTDGFQVSVRLTDGTVTRCVLRGKLREEHNLATSPIVVGDRVEVQALSPVEGVVARVLPRSSQLARRQPLGGRRDSGQDGLQVMVANLDLAVIVVPAPPRRTVIDRYVALARSGGCDALVCINKVDLADGIEAAAVGASYDARGTRVLLTSALRGDGVDDLRKALVGKLVAFVGPSGAGKSSLLNALVPELGLRVGALAASGKGAHTTTWSEVFQVVGAQVADTPGLREVSFAEGDGFDLVEDLFAEIKQLEPGCKFRNCSHTHEPSCAVKSRLDSGELDPGVYRRYVRLARRGMA